MGFYLNLLKEPLYEFDAQEAGDAIALNCTVRHLRCHQFDEPAEVFKYRCTRGWAGCYIMCFYGVGILLTLLTHGQAHYYIMPIYNLGTWSYKAVWESNLEPFPANLILSGNMSDARFSQDAICLVLAENHDVVHSMIA